MFLNDRFPNRAKSAKGTQEPSEGLRAERQQTEWTGHWLCICQQSGISLNPPPAAKRVRHHGHSQLSAGLLPFRFPGRPAAGCPQETFIVLVTLWQLSDLERAYNVESDRELLGQSPRRPVSLWPTTMSRLPATGVN